MAFPDSNCVYASNYRQRITSAGVLLINITKGLKFSLLCLQSGMILPERCQFGEQEGGFESNELAKG